MTPEEFNDAMQVIENALNRARDIGTVSQGLRADNNGTLPELYVNVNGLDLCLTASPL